MKQLGKVLNKTSWAQASNTINTNSESVFSAVTMLENATFKHKGYFLTSEEVEQLYPSAEEGSQAFVYNSSNPSTAPYDIYQVVGGTWTDTGLNGGSVSVDLTKKQDTLVGYSESVSGGKATQVAIQGDTIALSGKVSLGNVDNMESAILMSSSQAGAAIAKANTLEQSMNAIKSPIKPIQLNSQGKLELNIGKGLYVEDGKLCTTGASGGGGGGATLSEGAGISILNNKISVAYNTKTLGIDSCGGLTVNYGEGLTIKNGKLSAQASVNAGNGLVKKGEKLQVSVGTGLVVEDDVYVNIGKGLATDNENKVNVNLDEQTLTTDSCGKVIVNKCSLIGNGLKQESSKLAVNYGTGLALSNKAIVVNYGTGLSIQDGKLVSTVQGGKTYVGGQAVNITGNEINVKYDGVTISTKDSTDKSLHVMLGSGLKQGTSGIDVAVGAGLAIGSDNKLYSTVSSGATYSAGDGISISGGKISFNLGTSLESKCGYIQVAISSGLEYDENNEARIRVKAGKGITIPNTGEVRAHLSNGLAFDNYGAIKICDAVLTDISNLKDSKQDKLTFGSGLTQSGSTVKVADSLVTDVNTNKSNIASLQTAVANKQDNLTFGSGLTKSGNTITVSNSLMTDVSNNKSNISALQTTVANIPTYSAGDGISISGNKIAVQYCDGLQITNDSLAIATGDGLHIKDNRLAINPSFGLGFTTDGMLKLKLHDKSGLQATSAGLVVNAGVALGTSDGKLNVQYGTGLGKSTDNKLQVLLGTGLAVEGNYIRVEEAVYDSIEEANAGVSRAHEVVTKLQTALGGKQNTLTLATGLEWGKTDMIQVKMNAPLHYDNCGRLMLNYDSTLTVSNNKLGVDLYGVMGSGEGLFIKNNGLAVNVGRGLKIDSCQVVVNYGTGMSDNNNKIYVDTSKIAGAGIDLDSTYKTLTIGTKAAQELAGKGLVADGRKMKVKYGSGLTTNSCGNLIVDAANLTAGNADKLGGVSSGNYPRQTLLYERGDYQHYVVLLCKDGAGLTNTYHRLSGRIYSVGSGFARYVAADVDIFVCDWNGGVQKYLRFDSYGVNEMDLVTCNYGGVKYLAIRIDGVQAKNVYFEGTSTKMLLTPIKYYTSNTNTVNNAEIYGSMAVVSASQPSSNGNKYALVTDTVARATADANGNNITETYARRFMPTNGLEINSDRELFLPNLTASVVNGAVDGSKNGAQRVLNLNCGVIQIKLSTGLAIDDNGYLYVQDKYVTK